MRTAGFVKFRQERAGKALAERVKSVQRDLEGFDVIKLQEKLTGRTFDPTVNIVLLLFCKPHGIKVQGQTFLQAYDYDIPTTVRIAAHEMLHPPVPLDGPAARAALGVLSKDTLITRIVKEHDPRWGYTTLDGLLNEDLCQALDQLIQRGARRRAEPRRPLAEVRRRDPRARRGVLRILPRGPLGGARRKPRDLALAGRLRRAPRPRAAARDGRAGPRAPGDAALAAAGRRGAVIPAPRRAVRPELPERDAAVGFDQTPRAGIEGRLAERASPELERAGPDARSPVTRCLTPSCQVDLTLDLVSSSDDLRPARSGGVA